MARSHHPTRPFFKDALATWKDFLQQRALPTELVWIFGDNLLFEPDAASPNGFRLGFQTRFTTPPTGAEKIAFDYFSEFEFPLVFYRLGTSKGRSVCLFVCDNWFGGKTEAEGFWHRQEWGIAFRPGAAEEIEEITDVERWKARSTRNRPLHDLDFCMDLRAVHEILAHGRVLSTYEHYALKLLHIWRRVFEERGQFHQ